MRLIKSGEGAVRQPPLPNAPVVTVIVGGDDASADVGFARISVAAGAAMVPHRHNGSDVVIMSLSGTVRINTHDGEFVDVGVGDSIFIGKDEEVGLANIGGEPADLVVAAGPAKFLTAVSRWPQPGGVSATP